MRSVLLAIVMFLCLQPVFAATPGSEARSEARLLRQETRQSIREDRQQRRAQVLGLDQKQEQPKNWSVSFGVSYEDAEHGGHTWSTPASLTITHPQSGTRLGISTDGYAASSPGSESGFSDVTLMLSRTLKSIPQLTPRIGVTLPMGGDVGSADPKERVGLRYRNTIGEKWEYSLDGQLVRASGDVNAGASRFQQSGKVSVTRNLGIPDVSATFEFLRVTRNGRPGSTMASLSLDFPLKLGSHDLDATLSYTRGLKTDFRDNALEFDVAYKF